MGLARRGAAGTIDGVVWAPIFEELAFRGLLYPTLRLRLPPWLAALLSAALFGGPTATGCRASRRSRGAA